MAPAFSGKNASSITNDAIAFFHLFGNPGHHHPAIGMADQHDVRKLLPLHLVDDVQDLHVQINIGSEQVRSFGNSSECRGEHFMVICGEQPRHATPAPGAAPPPIGRSIA
jgi:hypothetical protein